jgi:hypothetical protein
MDATNDDVGKSVRVVFDRALAEQLEDWRRRQPRIPTIAEGVRRLVARGIANDKDARA